MTWPRFLAVPARRRGGTRWGLHALQHRGQEAVGIVSLDGRDFYSHRGIGHVAQVFSDDKVLEGLPGTIASGHVRYSTTGGSGLRNIQPLFADLAAGGFSIAHNGNISNAMHLKKELVSKGSIVHSTSDIEVIIHLIATSRFPKLLDRFVDALRMVEGAYSLICVTPKRMVACRDPLGIRPLVMGRIGDAVVFLTSVASENARFYNEALALPMPAGLTPELENEYLTLLSQQVAPNQTTAQMAEVKVKEFWSLNSALDSYKKFANENTQWIPLIVEEVGLIAEKAPADQKVAWTQMGSEIKANSGLDMAKPSVAELEKARNNLRQHRFMASIQDVLTLAKQAKRKSMVEYLEGRLASLNKKDGDTKEIQQ